MKNLVLSQIDLDIQEVDLKEVKGGLDPEAAWTGRGTDGRTGGQVNEYIIIDDDDNFRHVYDPIP